MLSAAHFSQVVVRIETVRSSLTFFSLDFSGKIIAAFVKKQKTQCLILPNCILIFWTKVRIILMKWLTVYVYVYVFFIFGFFLTLTAYSIRNSIVWKYLWRSLQDYREEDSLFTFDFLFSFRICLKKPRHRPRILSMPVQSWGYPWSCRSVQKWFSPYV